jgi:hypothetical protein
MKFTLKNLGVTLIMMSLSSCISTTYDFRYKMIVEIQTPEGISRGYTIIEEKTSKSSSIFGIENSVVFTKFRGSAVVINVPGNKYLFALLRKSENEPDVTHYAHAVFKNSPFFRSLNWIEKIEYIKNNLRNKNLSEDDFPMIVYFEDPRNIETVKKIDPDKNDNNSIHYKIKSVKLDITDEDPKFGIEKILPWISVNPRGYLSQKRSGKDYLLKKLDTGDFERK